MKKEFLACLLGLGWGIPACAQQYELTGNAPQGVQTVYLQNIESQTPDSVQVQNGTFTFKGDAQGKIFAFVAAKGENASVHPVQVVLDGKVQVDLTVGTARGNAENEGLTTWAAQMKAPQQTLNALMAEVASYRQSQKEIPDSVEARIDRVYTETMQTLGGLVKQCCEQNAQLRFPAYFLIHIANSMDRTDVVALAENGKPAYMDVPVMGRLKKLVSGWKKQMPGIMFTDLTMNNPEGQAHKLSEYVGKGKYILIDFWASWCGPCRQSMPALKAVYDKYKGKNFDIVGLSFDQDHTAWVNAIKKLDLPWIHLSDLKGWGSIAGSTYGVNSIPATLLIGPDGKIVASGLHAEELDAKLAELLQ